MQNPFQQAQALLKSAIVLFFWTYAPGFARADGIEPRLNTDRYSKVQLFSGGSLPNSAFYQAGLEIDLTPGAMTYWRLPGDAGVPPVFSFDGSQNLYKALVFFPAPQRIDEAGETAFGYKGNIIFPLHILPAEPGKPVMLNVKLDYAVCTKICLPETVHLSVELSPRQTASPLAEAALDRAEKALPKPLSFAETAISTTVEWAEDESRKTGVPAWRLTWRGAPPSDLFVEAPEGWYFKTEKTANPQVFLLTAVDHPRNEARSSQTDITVTLLEKDQSFEFKTKLKTPFEPN